MASTVFHHAINLDRAYADFGPSAEYNPEWFSGVIVHFDDEGITGLIYSNGKVLVSGATNMDSVYDALDHMIGVLQSGYESR